MKAKSMSGVFGPGAHRRRPNTVFGLRDTEVEGRTVNLLFGLLNIVILLTLVVMGTAMAIMTVSPADWTQVVTNRSGSLPLSSRAAFLAGSILCFGTIGLIGTRLENVWRWARLSGRGEVAVNELGITLKHDAVLARVTFIPWANVRAIDIDDGEDHDSHGHWRRFALSDDGRFRKSAEAPRQARRFAFATDEEPIPGAVLIAARPTPPNIVIALARPAVLRNPHVGASDAAFPPHAVKGMPARPPREETTTTLLFLRAGDPARARRTLEISNCLRPLHHTDLQFS